MNKLKEAEAALVKKSHEAQDGTTQIVTLKVGTFITAPHSL
jgi:hypothetical protein